jgi:DNA polymerase III delta subunit
MIYLFYGNNQDMARIKATALVESLQKKRPDASFFKLTEDNWNEAVFDEYLAGQGLFVAKYIIQANNLLGNKEIREYVEDRLAAMKEAEHIFVLVEDELPASIYKKLEKNAEKILECSSEEKAAKREFNLFSLTDALGARDRKKLWMLYREAADGGAVAEEVHGVLFWQVKSMLVAAQSADMKAAGLSPFVYNKSKGYAKNFKKEELAGLAVSLMSLYHEAHRGATNFELGLEKWVLEV